MKFLVTGGAGFIGSNYLEYVTNKYLDDYFVCLDKLTYASNLNNLNKVNKNNFEFIKGDINDRLLVDSLFLKHNFDYVINFAAESHVDNSICNPSIFLESNVKGVGVLLDLCVKYQVKRFHQVSTDEVYGSLSLDSKEMFYEDSMLNPSSPYSASKAAADLLCLAYHKTYGLDITISRSANNYGKYQNHEKLIPLMLERAFNNQMLPIYGNGLNKRDWLSVYENNLAIDFIVRNGKNGEIYNISNQQELSNIELVKRILQYLDKPLSLISYVTDRKGHDLRYLMNSDKLKALGFSFNNDFSESLNECFNYYLNQLSLLKD